MNYRSVIKALASLKLAVIVILALAGITAWGTFVEAEYDAAAAQKIVYHSIWMYSVMAVLAINLTAVMVDRWPWQKKHTGFVCAHIGIIILMIGSIMTQRWGIDGQLVIPIGESGRNVMTNETDLAVYTSLDGATYSKYFDREVDFFRKPPSEKDPLEIELPDGKIRITDYMRYAFREEKIIEAKAGEPGAGGAAIRFQLQNARVSLTEWLAQPAPTREAVKDLGPAQVVITTHEYVNATGKNTLVLRPKPANAKTDDEIEYEIHTAREPKSVRKGRARPGDTIETGWMGLVLRILKYMPSAREEVVFKKTERPTEMTTSAIKIEYNGRPQWTSLNSFLKLFSDQAVYVVAYANRKTDIKFEIQLRDFRVGRYQGTMRAASYESLVNVPGLGERVISMNEPLVHRGLTFYQSSFQEDETGRPVLSVLSVNRDPGRWVKYLGSLLIVLGVIHMFYFKRMQSKAARPAEAGAKKVSA